MSKQKKFTKTMAKVMAAVMLLAVVIGNPLFIRASEILSTWTSNNSVTVGTALYASWAIQPISIHNYQGSLTASSTDTIARVTTIEAGEVFSHIARSSDLVNWHIIAPNSFETSWHFFNGWYFANRPIWDEETQTSAHYIFRSDFAGNTYMLNIPRGSVAWGDFAVRGDLAVFGSTVSPDSTVWITSNGLEWSPAIVSSLDAGQASDSIRMEGLAMTQGVWRMEEFTQRQQGIVRSIGFGYYFRTPPLNTAERNIVTDRLNIYHNGQLLRSIVANNQAMRISNWAIESVERAYEIGLEPTRLWSFTANINRSDFAEMAVVLYELHRGEITGRVSFTDNWSEDVEKAAYIGVVTGVAEGIFSPWTHITREQAAVMLARLADALDINLPPASPTFADSSSISGWAADSVGRVNAAGIMLGVSESQFNPQGNFTGEQTIITLLRLFDMLD